MLVDRMICELMLNFWQDYNAAHQDQSFNGECQKGPRLKIKSHISPCKSMTALKPPFTTLAVIFPPCKEVKYSSLDV